MKFPTLKRSKQASNHDGNSTTPAALQSSQNTSSTEIEKERPATPLRTPSTKSKPSLRDGEKVVLESTAMKEMEALDKLSDEPDYPTGAKLGIIIASLCLSVFLMALDNTIIATAIPKITDKFNALDDVGWYGSGNYIRLRPTL